MVNASSIDGVEGSVQFTLLNEGYTVVGASMATERGRPDTLILVSNPDAIRTAETLLRRFGLNYSSIQYVEGGAADVTLVIGDNLATFFAPQASPTPVTVEPVPEVLPTVAPQ